MAASCASVRSEQELRERGQQLLRAREQATQTLLYLQQQDHLCRVSVFWSNMALLGLYGLQLLLPPLLLKEERLEARSAFFCLLAVLLLRTSLMSDRRSSFSGLLVASLTGLYIYLLCGLGARPLELVAISAVCLLILLDMMWWGGHNSLGLKNRQLQLQSVLEAELAELILELAQAQCTQSSSSCLS